MNITKTILKERAMGTPVKGIAKIVGVSIPRVYQILDNHRKVLSHSEEEVREKITEDGWIVLRNGYPDFFCYRPGKEEFKFVEVKPRATALRPNQEAMIKYLRKAGFRVEIISTYTKMERHNQQSDLGKKSWEKRKKKLLESKVGPKNNKPQ